MYLSNAQLHNPELTGTHSCYYIGLRDYLLDVHPDDSFDFKFDEPIELRIEHTEYEYNKNYTEIICKKTSYETIFMTNLHVYYWDDDDHRTCDFYIYYNDINGNLGRCKIMELDVDSIKKIYITLYNRLLKEGKIVLDDNGKIVKGYTRCLWG